MKTTQDERKERLKMRTRQFALRIIKLYSALPKTPPANVLAKQVLRSGTSVGAHYAESCRAKSRADFLNKIEGAMQELEETMYWFDLLEDAGILTAKKLSALRQEAIELMAIIVTMVKNTRANI
jgi:four helix bundle protein